MQKTLKRQLGLCSVSLFLLFLLTACTGSEKMRRDLDALQEKNLADSLLTDSTLAMTLADYFDSHGERLEAHYLLARTWTDLGQAPRALDAFHTAAEQADTTRLDSLSCHWLSRIYGQMGGLLYNHQLPYNAIDVYDKAEHYALECKEMATAAIIFEQKAACYYLLGNLNQAVYVMEQTYHRFLALNDTMSANLCLGPLSFAAIKTKDYKKAKDFIQLYEHHSIYSDKASNDYNRWKLLYCDKGFYYLGIGKADSALHYFKKAYNECQDTRDLTLACQGLYLTYEKLSQPDSTAKYAVLYAQTNDSTFLRSVSSSLLSIHYLYDYNQIRNRAERSAEKAHSATLLSAILSLIVIIALLSAIIGYVSISSRNRQKLQRINAKYVTDMALYAKAKAELKLLSDTSSTERLQLEDEIAKLRKSLEQALAEKTADNHWDSIELLLVNPIVTALHQMAAQGKLAGSQELKGLLKVCNENNPYFMVFLQEKSEQLDNTDLQICLLTKLHFLSSERSVLLGISSSNLSHRRKRLYKKLFGTEGSATAFDERIHHLG